MKAALAMLTGVLALGASPSPPPTIYQVVTRPLCAQLHDRIAPAIGMMLQNDSTIRKGPDYFKEYNTGSLYGSGPSTKSDPVNSDPGSGTSNSSQNIALLGMENLIRPIANNIIAIQTLLDSPQLTQGTGQKDDDKRLGEIRAKLLHALAAQSASLDIISGFVDTQQMADLQHAGEGYISSISSPDSRNASISTPAPNPLEANPNYAGLAPNPYAIDPASIPGLTLGYNPVTRLQGALTWTISEAQTRENEAAKAVMASAVLCGNAQPTPTP